ncbi:MAG: hypothetical protein DYH13_03570 [Alphaproteobacteria bacterium PRO2]|nr:hypothetical protein [Alphaproteobacteria bacterium PRO2]
MSKKLEKLFGDTYLARDVPESVHIPPLGTNRTDIVKPIEHATLDDIAFAAQALDKKADALRNEIYALQRLYREARAKGALGRDNIVEAVTGKNGGAQ